MRLRLLASEPRGLRTAAGFTREQVSERTARNNATLYCIETAKARPHRRTLLTLLDMYGVTDADRRAALVATSKQASELDWLHRYESELPEAHLTYISFEPEARGTATTNPCSSPACSRQDYAAPLSAALCRSLARTR